MVTKNLVIDMEGPEDVIPGVTLFVGALMIANKRFQVVDETSFQLLLELAGQVADEAINEAYFD